MYLLGAGLGLIWGLSLGLRSVWQEYIRDLEKKEEEEEQQQRVSVCC